MTKEQAIFWLLLLRFNPDNNVLPNEVIDMAIGAIVTQLERKRGIWTKNASCPFCGFQPWYEKDIHTLSFCPHCGADLRGERDE